MALVGHYKLNGDATDSSGKGYHGTVSGATLATDKNGIANNCYSFDGASNYINLNRNLLTYPENFSISLWTYDNQITGDTNNRIFSGGGSGAGVHGFNIGKDSGAGTIVFFAFRTTDDALTSITGTITKEVWTHVVCIKNGTAISMYLNGILVDSDTLPVATFKDVDGANTYLGGVATANSYNGLIDDVRIYDHILSLKEIKELSLGKFAHYKFNGNAKDCSGSDLNGTAYNNISYDTATPLIGSSSLSIPGTAQDDRIDLPFGNGFNPSTNDLSISMWVTANSIATNKICISTKSSGTNQRFFAGIISSKWDIGIQSNTWSGGTITAIEGKKTHLGIVFNKTTLKCNMYVDGFLTREWDYTSYTFPYDIRIGGWDLSANTWDGLIDDVQFFSTALTQQDFIDIMQTSASITKNGDIIVNEINEVGVSSGLVGYWNFKEGSGTSFYNKINRNTYTGVVDLAWATWLEYGIETSKLSTTNDMVYVSVGADTNLFITGDLTYSLKFKVISRNATSDYLISRRAININFYNNTEITCRLVYGSLGEGVFATTSGANIIEGKLFQVIVTIHQDAINGGGYIKIYVDGVLLGSEDLGTNVALNTYAGTRNLRWGATPFTATSPSNIEFRDTKIFNRILTEDEILQESKLTYLNANKQIQAKSFSECSITDGLVGWYPLRKNANDYSGSGYNGTVSGAVVSTNRFSESGSYSFDGIDDYINLNRNLLTYPENFTVSLWVYNDISGTESYVRIFDGGQSSSPQYGFAVVCTATDQSIDYTYIFLTTNNSLKQILFTIPNSTWTYITLIKNGTLIQIYINGMYFNQNTLTQSEYRRDISTYIGGRTTASNFKGKIDDVRIYDRALTEKEIALLYEYGKTKITNDGIVYTKEIKEII